MATDDRDVLEILKKELEFFDKGGYAHSLRTPWRTTSIFRDSPSCLNYGDPEHSRPCDQCLLTALVPEEHLSEKIPCHHIPLNADGETIHFLEQNETPEVMHEKVKDWLRRMIKLLEEARAK